MLDGVVTLCDMPYDAEALAYIEAYLPDCDLGYDPQAVVRGTASPETTWEDFYTLRKWARTGQPFSAYAVPLPAGATNRVSDKPCFEHDTATWR